MLGTSSNSNDFTLKLPICCIVVPGPFPLQPYYSRGKNVKFYSTSHVNTFLMITNARGDYSHNEKASRIEKKTFFFKFCHFFSGFIIFFPKCAFKPSDFYPEKSL